MKTALSDIQFEELDLVRSITRESYFDFVLEFWDVFCAEKFIYNWHIKYLCNLLQYIAKRVYEGKDTEYEYYIINISPGTTKSSLISVTYPPWIWSWFPSASYIGSSYTYSLAVKLSRMSRLIVKSEKYQACFPDVMITSDQDAKGYFVNVHKGERMCAGIDGDIVGRHADIIGIDDPLNPKGARSEAELESAEIFITETLSSRKKNKAVVPTILIMQRLSQADPTGMLLEKFGDRCCHICIPAEESDKIKPESLRRYYKDGLMDPVRLSREVLQKEKIRGDYYYSGQFMQDPIPLGGGMFKTERIRIVEPTEAPKKWKMRIRYWDKAGTRGMGAYTAGVLMGENCDNNYPYWVLDVKRGRWDAAQREAIIRHTAETDGQAVIVGIEQEPGSSGKESAEATVRNLAGFRVRTDRPTGDKAVRADPFSGQVNAGNVSMIRGEWNTPYVNELAFFPFSTYKDQTDASSGAFKQLSQPQILAGGGWA